MSANGLSRCLPVTLAYEGGYSDDPRDPGGKTMRGVTQRVYDAYRARHGLPKQIVMRIGNAELYEIYSREYWAPAGCEALKAGLDMVVFDCAVNSGVAEALKLLAQCNSAWTPRQDILDYSTLRLGFMHRLRTWRFFNRGWTARVKGVQAKALTMLP